MRNSANSDFAAPDAQRPSAYEKQSSATKHAPSKTHHGNGKARKTHRQPSIEHAKRGSATKSGPGRRHVEGKPGNRLTKQKPLRAYRALMAYFASKRVRSDGNRRGIGLV